MKTSEMTLNEIRQSGLEALDKALGPVGVARFLQLFGNGKGDYSAERARSLGRLRVEDLLKERTKRRHGNGKH